MTSLTSLAISAQNTLIQMTTHDHGHGDHHGHDHSGHSHGAEGESLWTETWNLITDPAHAITEIFYSFLFELLIIPVILFFYRKWREPKLRAQIHREIDAEHGIKHSDCNNDASTQSHGHVKDATPVYDSTS